MVYDKKEKCKRKNIEEKDKNIYIFEWPFT